MRHVFQFLMVQLKDNYDCLISPRCQVVSIPYGTIKSADGYTEQATTVEFQFLMVQLKGLKLNDKNTLENVSIPYGTIKRTYIDATKFNKIVSIPYGTIKSHPQTSG